MKTSITSVLLCLLLFVKTEKVVAGFTLSGNVITQTGTDTDLSGLAGISGVTVIDEERGAGLNKKIYLLSGRVLRIRGTLTIDATKEKLVFEQNCPSSRMILSASTASLTIRSQKSPMGNTVYMEEEAILFLRPETYPYGDAYSDSSNGDLFLQQGSFTWNGGIIRYSGSVGISVGTINKGSLISYGNGALTTDNGDPAATDLTSSGQLFLSGNLVVNDLKVGSGNYANIKSTNVTINKIEFDGMMRGAEAHIDNVVINNYVANNGVSEVGIGYGNKLTLKNPQKGTALGVGGHVYTTNAHPINTGGVRVIKQVQFADVQTTSGVNVNAVVYYIKDYDNGSRKNTIFPVFGGGNKADFPEGTADEVYTGIINNGTSAMFEVVTGMVKQDTNGVGNIDFPWDYRSKNGDSTDVFDIHLYGYEYRPAILTKPLKGLNVLQLSSTLLDDENISQTTKATVDAYSTIDNLDQLYDRSKAWKIDNVALEYPSINNLLIVGSGEELNLGNRNLIIDGTATAAFAVDTSNNTIRIKSTALAQGSKFKSIRTTGTVSTVSTSSIETGYIDSTGTNIYIELSDLDQQDIKVTDQQTLGSPVSLINLSNQSNTYKTHLQLPSGGVINILVERTGYAPWTENIPTGAMNFVRKVATSLSAITGENQAMTIDLLIKLLQKTEAVSNAVNAQGLPLPTVNVTTNVTTSTGPPSVDNQNVEIGILQRILAKMTAVRTAINAN